MPFDSSPSRRPALAIRPPRGVQADRDRALRRFAELIARAESLRVASLPFDELHELARLYRLHSARLARLREQADDPDATRTLNTLLVRAYTYLYGARPRPAGRGFDPHRLADALARTWPFQLVAWVLLAVGTAVGIGLALGDSSALASLVPASLGYTSSRLERLSESALARADFLAREETPTVANFFFGSMLFTHNTRVGLLSFATGMLGGIPTVILQIYNGLTLGALAAIFLASESRTHFLAWILPHGVPELTAICLCAAAGLQLGAAVVAPGRRSVGGALREASSSALLLVGMSVPLFLAAAGIESFVRESTLGTAARFGVAAAMGLVVLGLMGTARRLARERTPQPIWLSAFSDLRRTAEPGSGSAREP